MDLYEACENGNEERVVELLVHGDSSGHFHHPSSRVGGASHARNTQLISASTAVAMLKARSTARRTPLLAACIHGQVNVVRLLLGESCLVYFTSRDMEETNELLRPLSAEYTDFAQTLPHEARTPNIDKPLFQVTMEAKEGDADAVPAAVILLPPNRVIAPQDLLGGRKHVDVFGNTPLQCISCFGCGSADKHIDNGLEITKLLLFRGDQPNLAKKANKWTPLHWSAYNGNHEQCAILLDPGTGCPPGSEGRRIGKTQFSIPLLVNSDNLFAADVAGRRGLALLKEMNALRKLPPFKRSKYTQWRLRLDHIQVLRLFAQEFLENAPQLVAYVNDMNSRLPLHLFAKKKAPRFTDKDAIRYGQHLLYWMGCFGLVEEVQALLALKFEVPAGGDTLTRSTFDQLQPLYVCSCEENKRQSALHAVAVHGQQDIVRLLLSFLVFAQLNPVLLHAHEEPKDSPKKSVVVPFDDLDSLGKVEEQVGRDATKLDVLPLVTAGWRNYRNESPLYLAVLFLQYEVVIVFRQFLTAESLVWELGNCNVEGSFIHHVANNELRHDLGLHTTESTSSQRLKCTEYVLLFDGLKRKQFKESMIETLREDSVLSPSLQILRAGHKIRPARLCGLISIDRTDYVVVGATDEVLIRHAQALQLKIKHRGSSVRSKYDASSAHVFEPFRSLHRQQVVLDIIQKQVNLKKHLKRGNLRAIFPLHDVSGCKNIVRNWVRTHAQKRIFQPFNETSLKQFLLERRTHQYEMLWPLLTYFGEKHAFYYAFMMFYTVWLLLIAIPGAVCQLLSSLEIASFLSPLFAIIVSLWATLLVERWKRKRSEIQTNFGNFKRNRNEESPEFYGDFQVISPEKSIVDITFPKSSQLLRVYLGIPVLLTMASAVVVIFIGVKLNASSTTILREVFPWMPSLLVPYVIPVLNAISMLILDYVYTDVAVMLTKWENHRTVWQYESMLATKLFWFKFLNAFISLFWVAFVERNPTALRDQLIVIMGTRQIWYSFQRHILPLIAVTQKWKAAGFRTVQTARIPKQTWLTTLTSSLTPEWYHMEMTLDPKPTIPAVDTAAPEKDIVTGEAPAAASVPPIVLLQELMQPPDFLMGKQMELVLQYGYITMFVSVLPLAPLLALLSNVINTRLDIISCTQVKRRPRFESETEVSTFMNILEFMSFAAVAVNCAVLFFTSSQVFESLLAVFTSHQSVAATSYVTKLWILLVTEHGVLALKALLSLTIDDAATWVQNEEDRDDDVAKQSAQQERARSGLVDVVTLETDDATENDTVAQDLEALVSETLGQGDSATNQYGDDKALHRLLADKYASAIRDREATIEREQRLRMKLNEYVRAEHGTYASQNRSTRHMIRSPDVVQDKETAFTAPIASPQECCAICFVLLTRCVVESLKRCLSCRQFLCVNCDAVVHLDDLGVSEPLHCRVSVPVGGYKRHGMAGHFGSAQRTDRADLETLSQLRTMVGWFVQQEEFHSQSLPTEMAAVDTIVARSEAAAPLILRYLLNQKRMADPDSQ